MLDNPSVSLYDFETHFMSSALHYNAADSYDGNLDDDPDAPDVTITNNTFKSISSQYIINGHTVNIIFGSTDDGKSANQPVYFMLEESINNALHNAFASNPDLNIKSIYIKATTNGVHTSPRSYHFKGLAMDISRINGIPMSISGVTKEIKALQQGFDDAGPGFVLENYGPYFKHLSMVNHYVAGHSDHIHISVVP